jgi:hypothetical protein
VSTPLMYLRAGLLDAKEGQGVLASIAADPDLTVAQKQSLIQIYETFRRENARAAGDAPATTLPGDAPAEPEATAADAPASDPQTTPTPVRKAAKKAARKAAPPAEKE